MNEGFCGFLDEKLRAGLKFCCLTCCGLCDQFGREALRHSKFSMQSGEPNMACSKLLRAGIHFQWR